MKKLPIILAALLTLSACRTQGLPEGILDSDQMVAFLSDAYRLEAYNLVMYRGNSDISPEVRAVYDDILQRNGITQQEVEASLEYYSNHPVEYKEILNRVAANSENPFLN